MILVIVESPAKCKKIESFLGDGYKCLASFGHIRELTNGLHCIDIKNNFEPTFTLLENKAKNIKLLKTYIKKADEVILATDDDREGEAIAWHICKTFNLSIQHTKRIIFREITKSAVKNAIKNPIKVNMSKVNAQLARQVLDRLVGFIISPQLWKHISRKTKKGLSAGRCQTPALKIIYDNQQLIDKTPGVEVYNTKGIFTKHKLEFILNKEFIIEKDIIEFLEESVDFEHKLYDKKININKKKLSPSPFTTSKLQQKASNILHYSPKQTMMLAQKLYEGGYITYMRTDSKTYSKEFIDKTKSFIKDKWDEDYIHHDIERLTLRSGEAGQAHEAQAGQAQAGQAQAGQAQAGQAQEAHEAIRPTDINKMSLPPSLDGKQVSLYKLIWQNTIESCMADAIYDLLKVTIKAPLKLKYNYSHQKITFPGWLIVGGYDDDNTIYNYLNVMDKGIIGYNKIFSEFTLKNIKTHFTESRLVQALEENGIGRPSTFSGLVSKLIDRGYVNKVDIIGKKLDYIDYELFNNEISEISGSKTFGNEKNKLKIQPIGILVCEFLYKNYMDLFNFGYTSDMEKTLDIISIGKKIWYELCDECYKQLNKLTKTIKNERQTIKIDENHTYMIAKYGPVIKYSKEGETKFLGIKDNIDIQLLREGKYELKDILKENKTFSGKNLGNFKNSCVILKKGKYGLYIQWNDNNYSINHIKKNENSIKLDDVLDVLLGKKSSNPKIIKLVNEDISVRKGKYGPYLFYKTKSMSKPKFIKLKGKDWKDAPTALFEKWVKTDV